MDATNPSPSILLTGYDYKEICKKSPCPPGFAEQIPTRVLVLGRGFTGPSSLFIRHDKFSGWVANVWGFPDWAKDTPYVVCTTGACPNMTTSTIVATDLLTGKTSNEVAANLTYFG